MLERCQCTINTRCPNNQNGVCSLIPGACEHQAIPRTKQTQECCLCSHRKVCKYREEFEQKKADTYIKLECKYFTN